MKLGAIPENPVERIVGLMGLSPRPLLDTHIALLLARTVMEGARVGVYEALAAGPLTAAAIAERCSAHPRGMRTLLDALVGCEYLRCRNGCYTLTRVARTWLVPASPRSLHDKMLLQFFEWDLISRTGEYVRTGVPFDLHAALTPTQWGLYQRGMRATVSTWAPEVARRTPIPADARDMLDIGGSHGLLSVALCRRHPRLRSVVLDLPDAVAHAAPMLARERMGDRVTHRVGNALVEDFGIEAWDVVFIANLVHHFDEVTNRELAKRVARALRPGGICVIQELVRSESSRGAGQIGALLNLYFALTSAAGTWSFREIAGWQYDAGLRPLRPLKFLTAPGNGQQSAVKE